LSGVIEIFREVAIGHQWDIRRHSSPRVKQSREDHELSHRPGESGSLYNSGLPEIRLGLARRGQARGSEVARLLIVEDQKKILRYLRHGLEEEGYCVVSVTTGEQAYYAATTEEFEAVVLDLMLPGHDGLKVLRDLRAHGFTKPVLILTAKDSIDDRVRGLDAGADDYLVKPFAFAELHARLRALLRRGSTGLELTLRADNLEMDLVARRVIRDGVEIDLTKREFELLEYLLRHKNAAVTRDMIARDVWKDPGGILTNAIDVCVTMLRKKVERPGTHQLIQTVRGVGYAVRTGS
jgi:DNA-binding response OmpR family regulator